MCLNNYKILASNKRKESSFTKKPDRQSYLNNWSMNISPHGPKSVRGKRVNIQLDLKKVVIYTINDVYY